VTQQNSALVEENAATAKTLEHQAKAMDERVSFFKIGGGAVVEIEDAPRGKRPNPVAPRSAPAVAQRAVAGRRGGPVARMQTALAAAVNADPDWTEF
jgi:methyl-accepting chemotaxis protein